MQSKCCLLSIAQLLQRESGVQKSSESQTLSFSPCNERDSNVLPHLQAQGTVTAVQLQTEAPVVTASGQQVQTLQVVVSPPACVTSVTVCMLPPRLFLFCCCWVFFVLFYPFLCCLVYPSSLSMSYSCLNCMLLGTLWFCACNLEFMLLKTTELSSSEPYLMNDVSRLKRALCAVWIHTLRAVACHHRAVFFLFFSCCRMRLSIYSSI